MGNDSKGVTMEGICPVCNEKAALKCSNCYNVFYCSKDHQKSDWKAHKATCKPFIIKEDDKLGRHLIASKDFKNGHIIFKEKPLIVGPAQVTPPVCLGCLKNVSEEDSRPCEKCGWPVCNEACQNSPHHKPECELTVARGHKVHITTFGIPHPNYQCLTVLRCLYQKKYRPDIWNTLMALESHSDVRRGTIKWQNDKLQIMEFIKRFFKLDKEFSDDEIFKVCGLVQVNGHEVPLSDSPFVAIYDTTSMVEHNCRANCNKSFTSRGEVLIIAAKDISAGENISICYTDPLWGTVNRRHHLEETKFFKCTCERCSDVTELGTMFSALRCQKEHCPGFVLPKSFAHDKLIKNSSNKQQVNGKNDNKDTTPQNGHAESINNSEKINGGTEAPNGNGSSQNGHEKNINESCKKLTLEDNKMSNGGRQATNDNNGSGDKNQSVDDEWTTDWSCDKCDFTMSERSVMKLMEHVGRDLNAMEKGNCDSCLRFLKHYGKFLHHNHYYMIDVSLAMAQLIGQEENITLPAVTDERLEMKVDTCKKLAEFLEELVPAEMRARGGVLFELHAAIAENGRRRASRTGEGPAVLIEHLMESRKILVKAIHLLQHEPEELPEGKIAQQAKLNLGDMDAMLQNLHAMELPMSL